MAIFFTSDLHLGHENIVLKSRLQFSDIAEMDEYIIQQWNRKVGSQDEVYILGDFSFRAKTPVADYLSRLKGRKHLIIGNHDASWMKHMPDAEQYFESIEMMKLLKYQKKMLTLCHYPMLEWPMSRYSDAGASFLIHGHIHDCTTLDAYAVIKERLPHALNCGVDINHFEPVTFEELVANNNAWYQRTPDGAQEPDDQPMS